MKSKIELLQNQATEPATGSINNLENENSKGEYIQSFTDEDDLEGIARRASQANSKIVKPIRGGSIFYMNLFIFR